MSEYYIADPSVDREVACSICDQVGGPMVRCLSCDLLKTPHGRSAPLAMANGLCDRDCPGYREEPLPSELWPGERYGDSLGHMDWHEKRGVEL